MITESTRRTKHEELTHRLRELVATLGPGARLPSQNELMRRFQVSDRTVLRSLEDLRRDGWIVRRQGSGTFVAERAEKAAEPVRAERGTVAALALTSPPSPFYHRCLQLMAEAAEGSGSNLICHHARHELGGEAVQPLEALQPQGFVAFNYELAPIAAWLQERGHRAVVFGVPPVDVYPEVPCVYGDHFHGGYLATRHLLSLGHRRLAYVRLVRAKYPLQRSVRWRGHQHAIDELARLGESVTCELIDGETLGLWREDPARAGAFFRRADAPTALVIWNDTEALRILSVLTHAGLNIPGDLSVVGYDALREGAEYLPPLTSVDQHLEVQARVVMDLVSREEPPPHRQSVVVVPELVVRGSTAPPG
jgi:DNA-binding LacI/PurR family transcriptional regulator